MPEPFGIPLEYLIGAIVALIALTTTGLVLRARHRRRLADEARPVLEETTSIPSPTRDVLEDRKTIAGPVEIDDSMSLREIRELKRAKLEQNYKESESSQVAREWRKGAQDRPVQADDARRASTPAAPKAPAHVDEPTDAPPASPAEVAPFDSEDTVPADPFAAETPPSARREVTDVPPVATPSEDVDRAQIASKAEPTAVEPVEPVEPAPRTLKDGLEKTRSGFLGRIGNLFAGRQELDDELIEQVEEVLFTADIGAKVSQQLLVAIEKRIAMVDSSDPAIVWAVLREEVEKILASNEGTFDVDASAAPFVTLVVGVNGAGKTTTIGKLAARYQRDGHKVLMVAGDTFRAAAVEQLERWADRVGCGFHRGEDEADPSSVIYDGIERAKREGFDLVLCDTAGRLHTRAPLVDELKKIHRVCGKAHEGSPHETLLVLDANTGQNAIQQAKLFGEAVDVTGIVLTKLDGTAKGGVILGICKDLGVPVYFIGIGEGLRDLRPFDGPEFVDALFA